MHASKHPSTAAFALPAPCGNSTANKAQHEQHRPTATKAFRKPRERPARDCARLARWVHGHGELSPSLHAHLRGPSIGSERAQQLSKRTAPATRLGRRAHHRCQQSWQRRRERASGRHDAHLVLAPDRPVASHELLGEAAVAAEICSANLRRADQAGRVRRHPRVLSRTQGCLARGSSAADPYFCRARASLQAWCLQFSQLKSFARQ